MHSSIALVLSWFLVHPSPRDTFQVDSDVHADEMDACVEDYGRVLDALGWNDEQVQDVMEGNAKRIVNL